MTSLIPIFSSLVLLVGAFLAPVREHRRLTQRRAGYWASAALLLSLLGLLPSGIPAVADDLLREFAVTTPLAGPRHLMLVACANSLLGAVTVVLSPRTRHSAGAYQRILLLTSVGEAFLAIDQPVVLSALWFASVFIADQQLQESPQTSDAARLFRIYQLPGALLFFAGGLAMTHGRSELAATCLLLAIGLREAVLPGHGWFIRFVEKAPLGVAAAFVAPQLGVYAHIELLHGALEPETARFVAGIGAVSALFAAFMALGQTYARRAVAYLIMSQTALVAFGLQNTSQVGWTGAVVTWLVSSLGTTALLLCVAAVTARRGVLVLGQSASHPEQVPRLGAATLLSGLATVGAPLSLGFIAEDLLVQGSLGEHPFLGLSLIVVIALNGITVLRIYFGLFTAGQYRPGERDVSRSEIAMLSLVLGLLLLGGLFPGALIQFIQ